MTTETVKVPLVWYPEYPINVGIIDDNALYAFTHGQCTSFAIALSRVTGWQMQACVWAEDSTGLSHVWCVLPDGRYADITGVHSEPPLMGGKVIIKVTEKIIARHVEADGNPPLAVWAAEKMIPAWVAYNRPHLVEYGA